MSEASRPTVSGVSDDPVDSAEEDVELPGDDAELIDDAEAEDGRTDDNEHRDVLPEDLNASEFVGPYVFPNNNRRRIAASLYIALGAIFVLLWLLVDSPQVNAGFAIGGAALIAVGAYGMIAGWNLRHDEGDALVAATRSVGFPVGHASAQLGWRGWLSRPTWRILLYSNEPQPERRGLVLIDGYDGEVLDTIIEKNPEDWSQYV